MTCKSLFITIALGSCFFLIVNCSKKESSTTTTPPVDTTKPPVIPYKLVWSDEFDSAGTPDPNKWGYDIGGNGWGNSELEYYTSRPENAKVENGKLVITAIKEAYNGSNYTSARLLTKGKAQWTYGRFEIRAKLPRGRGTWPAIWLLSATNPLRWPDDGELDIMEEVGYNANWIKGSAHSAKYYGGNAKNGDLFVGDAQDSFHVYKLEWTSAGQVDWYVDDTKYYTYNDSGLGTSAWPYNHDFFIILNLAIGGSWGGLQGVDDSVFPQQMLVDYVRVYQRQK